MQIRCARQNEIDAIAGVDERAGRDPGRTDFIARSVQSGVAWVAVSGGQIVGYAVLEYSFFSRGFLAMLSVHPEHRRQGVASALVRRIEAVCATDKLFTSTNESNRAMQALLLKLEYVPSGIIENLDEGDPELVYCKRLVRKV
jgi:ribosomal protein S18 acetylase RimI-like enzyme